jgi:azobenzene reductase
MKSPWIGGQKGSPVSQEATRVLLVAGSSGHPSRVMANLDFLADILRTCGAITSIWDLSNDPLPLFDPHYYHDPYMNPSEVVRRFASSADQADAFVWGSPVYHNSFSGILKNALDCLTIRQFRNKPVALISCGNNERMGSQPCDHLRIVARGLLAVAIPTQLVAIPSDFMFVQGSYQLTNEALQERCMRLAEELIAYATLLRPLRYGCREKGYFFSQFEAARAQR